MMNKDTNFFQYYSSDIVYLISLLTSQLQTSSRKGAIKYVGPLVMYRVTDPHNYLLMTLDGKILRGLENKLDRLRSLFEHERLKPAIIRTSPGNVCNLLQLKQVVNIGMTVQYNLKRQIILMIN